MAGGGGRGPLQWGRAEGRGPPSPQPSKQCFTESSCGSDGCGAQLDPTMRPAAAC
jgi:hypothetical protein